MSDPSERKKDRLLPWIAAERTVRAVVLVAVGIVLLTHPHTNWGAEIAHLARKLGLDPRENWIQRILKDVARINTNEDALFGVIALAYGALEGAEAYGLWHRRRWGEWLTVAGDFAAADPRGLGADEKRHGAEGRNARLEHPGRALSARPLGRAARPEPAPAPRVIARSGQHPPGRPSRRCSCTPN